MRKGSVPTSERILLIDISNSFTKIAIARNGEIGKIRKIPTPNLSQSKLSAFKADRAIISSVVPSATSLLKECLSLPALWVDYQTAGVALQYPKPATIGADRLANAAAAISLGRLPAIVVDFGTAVTFDIIDENGCYLGGIIAPGLATAASALHERTALLPLTRVQRINSPIGKSTQEGIRIGLLLGAVGIVREVVARLTRETFNGKAPTVIATGGDADLVSRLICSGGGEQVIDRVDPLLTLQGLFVIGNKRG